MATRHFTRMILLIISMVIFDLAWSWNQLQGPIMLAILLPKDNRRPFSIHRVRPAIDIAAEKVRTLVTTSIECATMYINYADSMCSSADAMNEAINFYIKNKSHIFFGPCCDYAAAPVGRQTKYWNIPMITTALARDFAEAKADKYPMMTRVGSSINKMADFFAKILKEFRWIRVKILYQPKGLDYLADHMCHVTAESLHYM
ncbi:unnamed protein product [Candidula unifasciata]|uniref:Receptor ligand binding region domain-containing protein n=1 Tax=Candidula unifasciata TaxID=100452 RepID=A0A8S3ZEC0_9EUPU|nr:unnamed protein product [Candidula unifasciata]